MSLFGLDTPQAMLAKAKRDRVKLAEGVDADKIFNFFVTVWHVADYVERASSVPKSALDVLRANPSMKLARDLCDTAKHVKLTKEGRETASGKGYPNSMFQAPFGAWNFGPQKVNWMLHSRGKFIGVVALADEVLMLWDQFFLDNGLTDIAIP